MRGAPSWAAAFCKHAVLIIIALLEARRKRRPRRAARPRSRTRHGALPTKSAVAGVANPPASPCPAARAGDAIGGCRRLRPRGGRLHRRRRPPSAACVAATSASRKGPNVGSRRVPPRIGSPAQRGMGWTSGIRESPRSEIRATPHRPRLNYARGQRAAGSRGAPMTLQGSRPCHVISLPRPPSRHSPSVRHAAQDWSARPG